MLHLWGSPNDVECADNEFVHTCTTCTRPTRCLCSQLDLMHGSDTLAVRRRLQGTDGSIGGTVGAMTGIRGPWAFLWWHVRCVAITHVSLMPHPGR